MKAEHRHELVTNELADWIGNFPNFIKENIRPIIGVILILLGLGFWLFRNTQKVAAENKSQIRISEGIVGLEQEKFNRATMSWLAYAKFGNSWRLREKLGIIDDTPCF